MPTLVIGNKCYSSWSLRPWLLMRELNVPFDEVLIPLNRPDTKAAILRHSPAGRVPVLVDEGLSVWESIAIFEYVADRFGAPVWPQDRAARALARTIVAEMHAGFQALRSACPMNLGKKFGPRDRGEDVARDVARVVALWRDARARHGAGGPFLFGAFSGADAMYAPVVTRLDTYSIPVDGETRAYMDAVLSLPSFREWRAAGLTESWMIDHDEVDEPPIAVFREAAAS